MSAEDRWLSRMDPVELARQTVKGRRFEPISRRLDDASPPSEIVIVSMALPESSSFLDEAVLMDAVIDEINNDPDIFPNTTVRGLVMSEGTTVTSLLETLEFAYSAGACLTTGVTTGTRQAIMGSAAAVRNTNHGFWMDMEVGTMPRYSEFATSFGIFGWSTIIARLLDMLGALDPVLDRFALILPESFKPMADRFDVEQNLRGIAVVYTMIYDYRRVDVDATFDDADAYAAQIIDGVVASKANIIFQCFCSTNNKYFRGQLIRRAAQQGLMEEGFQWFTHVAAVVDFMEPWVYEDEYSDLVPYLDHFKVIDQPDYEPASYNYTTTYKFDQDPLYSDDILSSKIQTYIDAYDVSAVDRGLKSLSWLNCSMEEYSSFTVCDPTELPGLDDQRALKFDALKHIVKTLHEVIIVDGNYEFCDVDAHGMRVGDADVFLEKLQSFPLTGYSGNREFKTISVTGGEVLTLPPSFMLVDWELSYTADHGGYVESKDCVMHVNRWSSEDANTSEKVLKRNFFTGAAVDEITWMTGTTTSPNTWFHDMCGKGYRIDMDRVDKKCVACGDGEFNAPMDNVDECVSISDYYCPGGSYMVDALATGSGLTSPCMSCSAGTYSLGGTHTCTACPLGRFNTASGSSECIECSVALDTSDTLTTKEAGATSSAQCVCPVDTYRSPAENSCLPCPEGMSCPVGSDASDGDTMPVPLAGYMTLVEEPLRVYKCYAEKHCPGGAPAVCDQNRDTTSVACARCNVGSYEEDDVCEICDGGSSHFPLIVAGILVVSGVAALTISINRSALLQTDASLMLAVIAGVMITSVQILGIYTQMEIAWFEPLQSLFQTLAIFSFNIKVLKGGCVLGPGAVTSFVFKQLVGPCCIPIVWLTLAIQKRIAPDKTDLTVMFANTLGVICQGIFIAIILSAFSPMMCYDHPGDSGASMLSSPDLLCTFEGQHLTLVIVGLVALCAIPLPFLAVTIYAIRRYPSAVLNSMRYRWMQGFRFVFFKYRPSRYYFSVALLMRSLLVCLVPVVIRHDTALQVCMVASILGSWIVLQQQTLPWKANWSNLLDGVMTMSLLLLLLCGTMSTPATDADSLAVIGTALFITFGICLGFAFFLALSSKVAPRTIGLYICYNQSEAAAQVHYLKLLFVQRTHRRVFVDSETEHELNILIDVVKTQVKNFLIFLTQHTLRHTPCVAVVAAAHAAQLPIFAMETASFVAPRGSELEHIDEYLDLNGRILNEQYITMKDIGRGIRHLLSDATIHIKMEPIGGSRQFVGPSKKLLVSRHLRWCESTVKRPSQQGMLSEEDFDEELLAPVQPSTGGVPICCDADDPEALATVGIICYRLQDTTLCKGENGTGSQQCPIFSLVDEPLKHRQKVNVIGTARAVVVVLSHGSLMCLNQLDTIMHSIILHNKSVLIPVTLPSFVYPDEKYFRTVLPVLWATAEPEVAIKRIRAFLAMPAIAFIAKSSKGFSRDLENHIMSSLIEAPNVEFLKGIAEGDCEEIRQPSFDLNREDSNMLSLIV